LAIQTPHVSLVADDVICVGEKQINAWYYQGVLPQHTCA